MNFRFFATLTLGAVLPGASDVSASDTSLSRWQFQAAASYWTNIRIENGTGSVSSPSLSPKTDRLYDDGYNRVDASGNLGDGTAGALISRTGYFGFQNDSQVDLKAGTLALHQLQPNSSSTDRARPAQRPGVALVVRRDLAGKDETHRRWGIELGIDLKSLKESRSGQWTENLTLLTDTYSLGGVVPQRAPYLGRFSPLPGDQRIGDLPTRSLSTVPGTVAGDRRTEVQIKMLHLGPWLEILPQTNPLTPNASERDHWSLDARIAVALLHFKGTSDWVEQIRLPGLAPATPQSAHGQRRRTDLGALLGLRARRRFNSSWAAMVSTDFVRGSHFTLAAAPRYTRFDTSQVFRVTIGLEYALPNR